MGGHARRLVLGLSVVALVTAFRPLPLKTLQASKCSAMTRFAKGFGKATPTVGPWKDMKAPYRPPEGDINSHSCDCGSGKPYSQCCYPYHSNQAVPPTPEALLRARYTAFHLGLPQFLLDTLHPESAVFERHTPKTYLELLERSLKVKTVNALQVLEDLKGDEEGLEYVRFRVKRKVWLEEKSEFRKVGDRWFYFETDKYA